MLGLVESPVRPGDEFIEPLAAAHLRATDRHRYVQTGGQLIELFNLDTMPNLLRYQQRPIQVSGRQQHDEFLTAPARHGIAATKTATRKTNDPLQHPVTGLVPVSVVDALEMIYVDKN